MAKPPEHSSVKEAPSRDQQQAAGVSRVMSPQMSIYYSNSVMVATSPKDISLYLGRYVPATAEDGSQTLSEFYERQVYMTFQQADELTRTLVQTLEALRNRQAQSRPKSE